MRNIIEIWCVIVILPFFLGMLFRGVCYESKNGYMLTIVALILSVISFMIMKNPPVRGSELYGLRMIQVICFTIGSFLIGLIRFIKERTRRCG